MLIDKGEISKSMEVSKIDTCTVNNDNYRISSKRVVNKSLPVQSALNLKIDEFCHKHKKCLICDLNVNSLDLQYFVDIQREIKLSGLPNYQGCRIPVFSKLKIDFFRSMLVDYNDHILCDLLEFGFPIGYTAGDIVDIKKPRNHSGARDFPDFILKYLKKELEYKAVIGPLKVNPFIYSSLVLSPLNSVPKSTPGERRVILDLSFPSENCINAGIDKDIYLGESVNLTYPSVDDFVNLIKLKGRNCGIFKRDLKRAYRQIPIDPGDINFVGFHWKNHIFVDRVLSMGLRSSAHICQRVTSSVVYMMKQSGYLLLNYLDDFAGAEKSEDANVVFDLLGRLLDSCGLEESVEKASSPSTVMTFLGVKFDTSELTISVTTERVEEILLLVKTWLNLLVATVKQLQSLLLTWLRSLPDDKCDHIIPLYIRKDLFWWYHFLKSYNGVSMMALEDWSQPDEILETDATLSGCGGWFLEKREFFHVQFPSFLMDLNLHINQFELIALMICVKVWSVHFVNRKILVRCDNQSTVMVLNSGCTRDAYMQCCLREILFYAAKYNFEIKAVHFPGVENRTADILSRWHSDSRFEDLFYELPVVRIEPGTFLIVSDSIAKYVKLENADVFAFRGASIGEITYQLNKNKGSIYEGYKCLVIHCGTNDIHILSIDQFKSAYCNLISTAKLLFPSMVIALSGILPRPVDFEETGQKIKDVNMALLNLCLSYKVEFIHSYRYFFEMWKAKGGVICL
ncbi:unnamed protein product [Mytilus edulis]|uniref:Reverse transcriptase domain-containing protein n=2 Tax=Mytilus edulis TaxID=6550 RepID=A0A8S3R6J1_MYTED|nr:unnamed protein product [Mytilus edulis]